MAGHQNLVLKILFRVPSAICPQLLINKFGKNVINLLLVCFVFNNLLGPVL
jgi:hypothetical protein